MGSSIFQYEDSSDILQISSTGWVQKYAYIPRKLSNGKWIWFKPYYFRMFTGLDHSGFVSKFERADLFYVIANPDKAIFTPEMWKNEH